MRVICAYNGSRTARNVEERIWSPRDSEGRDLRRNGQQSIQRHDKVKRKPVEIPFALAEVSVADVKPVQAFPHHGRHSNTRL